MARAAHADQGHAGLLSAALDGSLDGAEYRTDPNFGFAVPVAVEGVDSTILDPRSTWADQGRPMTRPLNGW
jgi:ATP-dependent phosphoenolpyruvate carboxykinase